MIYNDDEVRVKLKVCITYDFIQELLSHGDRVKVIEPEGLVKGVSKIYKRALVMYE